jgi:uncharacterized lipoprotein YajG
MTPRIRLGLALAAASITCGCAFQNVPIRLPQTVATGLRGGDGRRAVVVVPFADERNDRLLCGMQKNGYGMRTARAVCSEDPAIWIAGLLAQELRSAGLTVLRDSDPRPRSAIRIKGTLLQFFAEWIDGLFTGTLECDVHVKLVVRSESGLQARRFFYVKGTESVLAGTHGEFQKAVDDAVLKLVQNMVRSIISLLDQFPELGEQTTPHPGSTEQT